MTGGHHLFVDVRHADKVRGPGAGSVLTAAQIGTVVRTALQLYVASHTDPATSASPRGRGVADPGAPTPPSLLPPAYTDKSSAPVCATRFTFRLGRGSARAAGEYLRGGGPEAAAVLLLRQFGHVVRLGSGRAL